jgi:hypothetical protein
VFRRCADHLGVSWLASELIGHIGRALKNG